MAEERHALLITSAVYDDPALGRLATPVNDAKRLGEVLKKPGIGAFSVTRITNPTSWRAAEAVEEFFAERSYDDVLLLYFSGHGLKSDDGELYFATRNTRRRALRSSSLPASFVRDVMKDSGSDRQVLMLDCCYGGAFARGLAKGDEAVGATQLLQGYGTVVLTASNALEFAWQEAQEVESAHDLSVFTRVVVEGLGDGSADVDGDGRITVKELYDFAAKRVRRLGAQQTPTLSSVGQEGDLVIARAPARRRGPTGPAIDLSPYVRIRNSGPEGSVIGMAMAVALESSLRYQGRDETLSARYAYAKARVLDGIEDWQKDLGATIVSGRRVAEEFGLPREETWPYVPQKPALPKGRTWEDMDALRPRFKARFHSISSYEEIPYHLLHGRPVLTGLQVFAGGWYNEETTRTGWIELSKDKQLQGGHAVVFVGYDSANDALKFANSWGTDWGDAGFGYIPREVVEQALGGPKHSRKAYFAIEVPADARHCLE